MAGRPAAPPPPLPSRTRFQKNDKFFGWFFGPARVRISYVTKLRGGVCCNVTKVHVCVVAMILTRAPHTARIWTTMHEKKQKNVMLLWECKYPHKHEHISAFCLCLCTYDDSQKSTTFFWVCCTNTVQILTACGALVGIPVNTQARTFATLQKKPLLSIVTYEILTRAGPKNHPNKVPKKAFRRAWISDC